MNIETLNEDELRAFLAALKECAELATLGISICQTGTVYAQGYSQAMMDNRNMIERRVSEVEARLQRFTWVQPMVVSP